ncbi:recombinase family protein [Rhodobacter capsulatus]|uniref:recombinase family protein n=1 Tax=Rhodobacter capsulatus TaxID=1061 RepID=UPI004027E58A
MLHIGQYLKGRRSKQTRRTVLYAATACGDHAPDDLTSVAASAGITIEEIICDRGSTIRLPLHEREHGQRLTDILHTGDTLVVRWLDDLGLTHADICDALHQLMTMGIIVRTIVGGLVFDGSARDLINKAARDSMIGLLDAMGQASMDATRLAQHAGIDRARAEQRYRGRKPAYDRPTLNVVHHMLANGAGASSISRLTGLSRQSILRIRDDPAQAEAALERWGI